MAAGPVVERSDSEMFPWAKDLDDVWHRRPPGRNWVTGDDANTETMCGRWIASAHVSNFAPAGERCPACTAGPVAASELAELRAIRQRAREVRDGEGDLEYLGRHEAAQYILGEL